MKPQARRAAAGVPVWSLFWALLVLISLASSGVRAQGNCAVSLGKLEAALAPKPPAKVYATGAKEIPYEAPKYGPAGPVTKKLDPEYARENIPKAGPGEKIIPGVNDGPGRFGVNKGVVYLKTEAERAPFKLHFGDDGKMYLNNGELFDTTMARKLKPNGEVMTEDQGRAIWVMDKQGNFYASNTQQMGRFHHSSFLAGEEIAAAGEMVVKDGKLVMLNDMSGHYKPTWEMTDQAIARLRQVIGDAQVDALLSAKPKMIKKLMAN